MLKLAQLVKQSPGFFLLPQKTIGTGCQGFDQFGSVVFFLLEKLIPVTDSQVVPGSQQVRGVES